MQQLPLAIGLLAGVAWVVLQFYPGECAPPTETSEVFCNRLWTPVLGGMLIGFGGVFVGLRSVESRAVTTPGEAGVLAGLGLMVAGNLSEYWFLNELGHQGPSGWIRSMAFMTLLLGFLLVLVGASVYGAAMLRHGQRTMGLSFVCLLPLTATLAVAGQSALGLPLGVLSVVAAAFGLFHRGSPSTSVEA